MSMVGTKTVLLCASCQFDPVPNGKQGDVEPDADSCASICGANCLFRSGYVHRSAPKF